LAIKASERRIGRRPIVADSRRHIEAAVARDFEVLGRPHDFHFAFDCLLQKEEALDF